MNDRRSDDTGSDGDSYGNRSWEEFLRSVRREDTGTGDDEDEATGPPPGGGAEEERPRETPPDPDDQGPGTARVVVPPEIDEFEGAGRRRRRLLFGGAATLALLVAGFLLFDRVAVGPDAAETDSPRAPAGAEERSDRFAARADSLAQAIASFDERRRDFDLGRIGCDGLARGLQEVQTAFRGLREVAGADGERLAPPARERFRRLVDDVRSVERAFSESECSGSP